MQPPYCHWRTGALSPAVPKLAVFYDTGVAKLSRMQGSKLAAEYFRYQGYQVLGADSLAFLGREP